MITNTHSVGVVRDAVIAWRVAHGPERRHRRLVVAAGGRRDLGRLPQRHQRLSRQGRARLAGARPARSGPVQEGNVGGGTGMICNGFKGGIGTASRKLTAKDGGYTRRRAGAVRTTARAQTCASPACPVGARDHRRGPLRVRALELAERGSIIVVVATDAPLLPHQLKRAGAARARWAWRATAASPATARATSSSPSRPPTRRPANDETRHRADRCCPTSALDPLFDATVQATEEAIVNALVAAETMTGIDDHHVIALPHERLREVLRKYNRLLEH